MAKVALVTGSSSGIGRYRYDYRRYCFSAGGIKRLDPLVGHLVFIGLFL